MITSVSASPATELCHCGHAEDEHDQIAARYCRATESAGLERGCTCPVGPDAPPWTYNRS
ncbi:RGCVC family protein [Sporichthya polymorpha]|uniref:RGCVC family protein n=1 Tax=Sporichthya polymorpha TaxID=35751 RepID=UPI000362D0A2|nr:RGCVC family protein [Sporichthya polymorpha]